MTAHTQPLTQDHQESRVLKSRESIENCLKAIRDQRTKLTLRPDNSEHAIECNLLDVVADGFLIEDISPREELAALRKHPRCAISARGEGMYAYIESTRIVEHGEERNLPYFKVAFPDHMLFQQRRRHARFRLPLRVSAAGAQITLFRESTMVGQLIDVSAGGCRAVFPTPLKQSMAIDEVIPNCAIQLTPDVEIHAESTIRHYHTRKDGMFVCGIELTAMHITDRRRLEQVIQSLSRSSRQAQ